MMRQASALMVFQIGNGSYVSDDTQAQERWIMQPSFKIDNKYTFILC
jgi:hypothetical protein